MKRIPSELKKIMIGSLNSLEKLLCVSPLKGFYWNDVVSESMFAMINEVRCVVEQEIDITFILLSMFFLIKVTP